jgi:hypothetical protein
MNNLPQQLQPPPQEANWWIDALCINQEDIEERSLHVLQLIRELGCEPTPVSKERLDWEYLRKPGQNIALEGQVSLL